MLSAQNQAKVDKVKEILNQKGIYFEEKANGQINADKVSYWATTEKWYDPKTGEKGVGLNSFLMKLGISSNSITKELPKYDFIVKEVDSLDRRELFELMKHIQELLFKGEM